MTQTTDCIEAKHIEFVKAYKQNPKTEIWKVFTKTDSIFLGTIKWYAQWRQYGFYPAEGTVFEKTCLGDIQQVCINLNLRQRLKTKGDGCK